MTTTINPTDYCLPVLRTVGDVVDTIRCNLESDNAQLREHAATLLGPRTRGSTTDKGLEELPLEMPLLRGDAIDCEHVARGCDCYKLKGPAGIGYKQAVTLAEAWDRGLNVQIRDGGHGLELYVDQPADAVNAMDPCDYIYIIVGLYAGEIAVFTWHPGRPLGRLQDGLMTTTGVKLHNG